MDLSYAEVGYFITQVANSAASFGVAKDDLTVVGNALTSLFDMRCSPETTVVPAQGPQLQAICIDDTCPLAANSTCSAYASAVKPSIAVSSLVPTATMSGSMSATGSSTPTPSSPTTGAGATYGFSMAAVAVGFAAMLL